MKIREVILDFTSLLDVVMIILFFFILYTTFDVEKEAEKAKAAEASYTEMKVQNEKEQQEWQERASEEWERILSADANAAKNQQALNAYDSGKGITFNLQDVQKGDKWTLSVLSGNKRIGSISSDESRDLRSRIKELLEKAGYDKADVIIATLTFDGNDYGTESAVPVIENAIIGIQREYKDLYFTTINTSK